MTAAPHACGYGDAGREAAILNALSANIAVLDARGVIVSVNEGWRRFGAANGFQDATHGVGQSYLDLCDRAAGDGAPLARQAAAGIRSVLARRAPSFSLEYSCHSPLVARWFLLTATFLGDQHPDGVVLMHVDITRRVEAEEVLIESEDRFSGAFEHAATGMALVSPDGRRWLKVNAALRRLLGYSEQEFLTRSVQDFTHPEDIDLSLENVRKAIADESRSIQIHKRYIHKNGTLIDALLSISLVHDAQQRPAYFVSQIQDVTEQNRVEDELRASNLKFHQLADHITDTFWIRSADMKVVHYVSPAFEQMWGRTVESLVTDPHSWADFIFPEDRERVLAGFHTLTGTASSLDIEYRIVRPSGEVRWIRSRGFQVRDDQGTLIRIIGIVTDITERQAAAATQRMQSAAMNAASDGILIVDRDFQIVWANPAFTLLTGFTEAEAFGRNIRDLFSAAHDTETYEELANRIRLGETWRGEITQHRKDGTAYVEAQTITPVKDEDGVIRNFICIKSDVSAHRRVESQLRRSQKLEAVGQLAAGVAHEFNNILQTLMSMATITRLRGQLPEIVKIAGEMENQIRRGAGITQQLLLASRHQELRTANLDMCEQVASAAALLRRLIPENIRLILDTTPAPASFEGDPGQIQQVLLNLAINARDAMPDGGTITLRVGRAAGEISLEVEDDGEGFDEVTREHMFEPFFTTKEVGKGTGLGLAVVYGIIDQHGGRIEISSRPGEGSLFRVILPETIAQPQVAPTADVILSHASGRVLLVEDEEGVREGLCALLEMIGYEVIAVARGEEAIALPARPAPDLLLSDVSLPGIGGVALAQRLRIRWPELRVTLMTGYIDTWTRDMAEDQRWSILQKPFELDALQKHLQASIDVHPLSEGR
jgi:two-component system, cell cycle sensor histidine kinase and response regulator CckA